MQRTLGGLVITVLFPVLAAAQIQEGSWENLNQLRVGQKIEVVDMSLKAHKGTFLAVSAEAVSFRVKKNDLAIQRSEVLRVSLRGKPKRWASALIGVGIGVVVGAAVVEAASSYQEAKPTWMGVAALIGGGAGAGVGAAVPFIPRGSRIVYRAQKPGGSP